MKNKHLAILAAVILTILATLACSLFSRTPTSLKFEPDTLPTAQMDAPYEAEIRVTQNNTPLENFRSQKERCPPGWSLSK